MDDVPEMLGLAMRHYQSGNYAQAELLFRRIIEADPRNVNAHHLLGILANQTGRTDVGIALLRQAIALNPAVAVFHSNLGIALEMLDRLDEASQCFQQALRIDPSYINAQFNLGKVFFKQSRFAESAECYQQILRSHPDNADARASLAGVLLQQGHVLLEQGQCDQAIAKYQEALGLQPQLTDAHDRLLWALLVSPSYDAPAILAEHARWNRLHAEPLAKFQQPHGNEPSSSRRLRIGYISPNFKLHVTIYSIVPLLTEHDHNAFEIFCYSDVSCPDELTERIRSHADVWRNIVGLGDEDVAELIRRDRIDILVDLTMHLEGNRLLVFARKPAPVQVCCIAYPGTTGMTAMDYRITDPHIDSTHEGNLPYSEESIFFPDTYWCYDPLTLEPDVNELPALKNGYVTFGNLSRFQKVNEDVLRLWAQVLQAVAHSRMMILAEAGPQRQRALELFEQAGVARDRVQFEASRGRQAYMKLYHVFDIGLDTFPYNGHNSSLDSLWMGVPVITLAGATVFSRGGVCFLENLGLPEMIARSPEQYVNIAAQLAGNWQRLAELRKSLRQRMRESPMMNGPGFARNMEAAYRKMWQKWCDRKNGIN